MNKKVISQEASLKMMQVFDDKKVTEVYDEDYVSQMTPRRALDIMMKTYKQAPLLPTYEAERTRGLAMQLIAEVLLEEADRWDKKLKEAAKKVLDDVSR